MTTLQAARLTFVYYYVWWLLIFAILCARGTMTNLLKKLKSYYSKSGQHIAHKAKFVQPWSVNSHSVMGKFSG